MDVAVHRTGSKAVAAHKANVTVNSVIVQTIKGAPASHYRERDSARTTQVSQTSI
jgi:hypothetical protein